MTDQEPVSAQAEVTIDADPDTVYALITDLPTLASLAEEARGSPSRVVRQDGLDRHRGPRPRRGQRRAHQADASAAEGESRIR
jgi:hypothetical protein